MNNFILRTITGAVFVLVMISGIWLSHESMLLLFALITTLGLWEFYSLIEQSGHKLNKIIAIAFSLASWILLLPFFKFLPLHFFILPGTLFIIELFKKHPSPFLNVAYVLLGLIYIVLPFYLLAWHSLNFYHNENGSEASYYPFLILGVFFLIWANDTFAYLTGKMFGKTKLFERISPKKTWEGTIGGAVFTAITAIVLSFFFTEYKWNNWIIISLIVSVAGTLGDLAESMFKRSLNIKDSGNLIPGHGGILDRFDSFMLAAPFVFFYIYAF